MNKATWTFNDHGDGPTLRLNRGDGHEISVSFYPPKIEVRDPGRVRVLEGGLADLSQLLEAGEADLFRAFAAAAQPRVMAD